MEDLHSYGLRILEAGAVLFNLIFLILLIWEKRSCWIYGIIASALSVALFLGLPNPLYSEAILYTFYIFFGIYGYVRWNQPSSPLIIAEWSLVRHAIGLVAGLFLTISLGYTFTQVNEAEYAYADAFSTSFSFLATYLEANKILSAWIYWIVLNLFTVWLYSVKGMDIYAYLMIVYSIMSVYGYIEWKKKKRNVELTVN